LDPDIRGGIEQEGKREGPKHARNRSILSDLVVTALSRLASLGLGERFCFVSTRTKWGEGVQDGHKSYKWDRHMHYRCLQYRGSRHDKLDDRIRARRPKSCDRRIKRERTI